LLDKGVVDVCGNQLVLTVVYRENAKSKTYCS